MIGPIEASRPDVRQQRQPSEGTAPAQPPAAPAANGAALATYAPMRIHYESDAEVLVTQYRSAETGEVRKQIPAPAVVETYRSRAALGLPHNGVPPLDRQDSRATGSKADGRDGTADGAAPADEVSAAAPEVAPAGSATPARQPAAPGDGDVPAPAQRVTTSA